MQDTVVRLAEGDLVQLKTGGPVMAVRFEVDQLLLCIWTDASGAVHRRTFSKDQLQVIYKPPPLWLYAVAGLTQRSRIVAVSM